MPGQELFEFQFVARLDEKTVATLSHATGLHIADQNNPQKDAPGHGTVTDGVRLLLSRGQAEYHWDLVALTSQPTWDKEAVETAYAKIRAVLPTITDDWSEVQPLEMEVPKPAEGQRSIAGVEL